MEEDEEERLRERKEEKEIEKETLQEKIMEARDDKVRIGGKWKGIDEIECLKRKKVEDDEEERLREGEKLKEIENKEQGERR